MKKLDFTPKNVINCVHNEPALWDTEFTDVHPELLHVSTHIIGFHFWKHSAIRIISVYDILFNPWSVSVSSWPLTSILFEEGLKQVCN